MRIALAIILTLVLLAALAGSFVLVLVSPFLFDDPSAAASTATWVMAGAVWSLPVTLLLALAGVWIARPERRSKWWYAALGLPVLSGVVFWVAGSLRPGFF